MATKAAKLFFAGTDTDVGKTFVAALVTEMYRHSGVKVGVYKPVASGCRFVDGEWVADDAVKLWNAAGRPRSLPEVCPQRFQAALAPPAAARAEGKAVVVDLLRDGLRCWESDFDVVIIEGAGGLFSPLADGVLNIDFCKLLSPQRTVIVAANRLGVIHQSLATCAAAAHSGANIDGLILCATDEYSDGSEVGNANQIRQYTDVPIIAEIGHGDSDLTDAAKQLLLSWLP